MRMSYCIYKQQMKLREPVKICLWKYETIIFDRSLTVGALKPPVKPRDVGTQKPRWGLNITTALPTGGRANRKGDFLNF
jgi:hypothetical protein